jgi:hypothetical protein
METVYVQIDATVSSDERGEKVHAIITSMSGEVIVDAVFGDCFSAPTPDASGKPKQVRRREIYEDWIQRYGKR